MSQLELLEQYPVQCVRPHILSVRFLSTGVLEFIFYTYIFYFRSTNRPETLSTMRRNEQPFTHWFCPFVCRPWLVHASFAVVLEGP